MILFKTLSWKNFLSTGNAGTRIQFDRSPTTLVQGVSGSGKSTMIDALCFSLYGKPFRDINKPGLVNSVNGKNCEVEVVFETNGKEYRVVRAIKPNRFDIFCNGKLVTQDAATRDYQKVLENQILMMTFKTFTQIVIIGSTAFTPFMQLPAGARREVIEDILDIGIFSTMNQLLKQQIQETKDQQQSIESDLKTNRERADGLKRLIEALSNKKDERLGELKQTLEKLSENIKASEKALLEKQKINSELTEKTKKLKELISARNELKNKEYLVDHECSSLRDKQQFFSENNSCPTCSQQINSEHKMKMVNEILVNLESAEEKIENYKNMASKLADRIKELSLISDQVVQNSNTIVSLETSLELLKIDFAATQQKLEELSTGKEDVQEPISELKEVAKKAIELLGKKKNLATTRQLQEAASVLLKDTGVKTAIIKEYLPLINKFLNRYLVDLQMDVEFGLDENFNEVIKSRHRDELQYGNFSTGERLRLDIALLMTWRKIASLKNSASTNLLIIDEILSGTLDQSNQDIVVEMVNTLAHEGSNIWIIAHGDSLVDKFRSGVKFEKQGNFSVMI